jgi:acetyl-CoA/propionyl-CoA carboxylase biotin carboxyl carrier protein
MLAKIVAHGRDRAEALERLAGALEETLVLGLTTNLRFLRWLVRLPAVADGDARIDTLEGAWPAGDGGAIAIAEAAWRRAAALFASGSGSGPADIWGGGWRLNAAPVVRLVAEDAERSVSIEMDRGTVEAGEPVPASEPAAVPVGDVVHVDVGGRSVPFRLAPSPDVDRAARAAAAAHHGGGAIEIVAPMPGSVLAVHVAVGAVLDAGDPIVTLEAMKMEHVIAAPIAGALADLRIAEGAQVTRGELLAVVEP